ncbi:hypothetical protein DZS_39980 [Dickeya ananatis]
MLEGLWLKTRNRDYRDLYHFWSKIFAVNFGMGVVSGLVMAYQFGTNWSGFSQFAGSITGPLLTYEVLTAFFLEAGFLGVMLFGWQRVGPGLHFFATCMVALGTIMSTFWILASNSWMQTPQGHEIHNGVVVPVDWLAVIFNPSFPYRLMHMATAAFLASAFFCRRVCRLAFASSQRYPGNSQNVVDGALDGVDCRPHSGVAGRYAWSEHAEIPAR